VPRCKGRSLNACRWPRTSSPIGRNELRGYDDVVFMDPNLRDTLFMMHEKSSRDDPRLARYTSMTRRRHLGTNITRDRTERFIKHSHNVVQIQLAQTSLTHTNSYLISSADFENYVPYGVKPKNNSVLSTNTVFFVKCVGEHQSENETWCSSATSFGVNLVPILS
jgi:hypothetical protein